MDAIPGPRRPLFRHIVVPFLPDADTIPKEEEWRKGHSEDVSSLVFEGRELPWMAPSRVDSVENEQSNPPLDHQQPDAQPIPIESSGSAPTIVYHFDSRSQPVDRWTPAYWDIQIQKDDGGDPAFTGQQDDRKPFTMSDKMRNDWGISADSDVEVVTISASVLQFLSEKARRNKPLFLPARDQQFNPGQAYDGLGFRLFPRRMGYDMTTLDHEWNSDLFLGFFHQGTGPEMAVFLQSWFFFGFISEVFGKTVREEDFVTTVSKSGNPYKILTLQKFITTRQWKSWEPLVFYRSTEIRDARIAAIKHALDTASKFTRLEDSGRLSHVPFIGELALAVRVLGSIFSDVIRSSPLADQWGLDEQFQSAQHWGLGRILTSRFLSDAQLPHEMHWCRNDLARMKLNLPVTALYYLSNFRGGDMGSSNRGDHTTCSEMNCNADSIDAATYVTEHCILCDKHCTMVGPDMEKVKQILSEGKIPLFRFKNSEPRDGMFTHLPSDPEEDPISQFEFETILFRMGFQHSKQHNPRHLEKLGLDSSEDAFYDNSAGHFVLHNGEPFDSSQVRNSMLWDEPLEIEVFAHDGSVPYVALSHVWADGLGNVTSNQLPACRLPFIQRMLWQCNYPMRLYPSIPKEEGVKGYVGYVGCENELESFIALRYQPIPAFWIDTFGIPREDASSKRSAIRMMSRTYSEAEKVLVLDGRCVGLGAGARSPGNHVEVRPAEEILSMIITSTWMRRLWTLQEGLLAKQLLMMFTEGPIDVQNFIAGTRAHWFAEGPGELVRRQLGSAVFNISMLNESPLSKIERLRIVWNASIGRTATRPGDVSLCLAATLDIDAALLHDKLEDERAALFYSLIPGDFGALSQVAINPSFIFSGQEKLSMPGYRWADKHLCITRLGKLERKPALIVREPAGLEVELVTAEASISAEALKTSTLLLKLAQTRTLLEAEATRRMEPLDELAGIIKIFVVLEREVDWTCDKKTDIKGFLAYLDFDFDQSKRPVLRIERYVTINALDHMAETNNDLDDGTSAPTLSAFKAKSLVLR